MQIRKKKVCTEKANVHYKNPSESLKTKINEMREEKYNELAQNCRDGV